MQSLAPFLGTWRLIPARSRYEQGTPPREATYRLDPASDGIRFTIDWIDAGGDSHHLQHEVRLGVDGDLSMEVRGEVLTTTVRRDGRVVAEATRTLSAGGTILEVVQAVMAVGGERYANASCYERA